MKKAKNVQKPLALPFSIFFYILKNLKYDSEILLRYRFILKII